MIEDDALISIVLNSVCVCSVPLEEVCAAEGLPKPTAAPLSQLEGRRQGRLHPDGRARRARLSLAQRLTQLNCFTP